MSWFVCDVTVLNFISIIIAEENKVDTLCVLGRCQYRDVPFSPVAQFTIRKELPSRVCSVTVTRSPAKRNRINEEKELREEREWGEQRRKGFSH